MYLAIVVYKAKYSDSLALRSLLNSDYSNPVLVYDNGECIYDLKLPQNFQIIRNETNQYLAKNYIDACKRCLRSDDGAIGFFDQDTEVDIDYLLRAESKISEQTPVVYPILLDQHGDVVSPLRLSKLGYHKSEIHEGIYKNISFIGINSGSIFDPKVMIKLIDPNFELDFLDHVICRKILNSRICFHVCKSSMKHCLSVHDGLKLNFTRQLMILSSEKAYFYKYRSFGKLFWLFIFMGRVFKSITIKRYPYSLQELFKLIGL